MGKKEKLNIDTWSPEMVALAKKAYEADRSNEKYKMLYGAKAKHSMGGEGVLGIDPKTGKQYSDFALDTARYKYISGDPGQRVFESASSEPYGENDAPDPNYPSGRPIRYAEYTDPKTGERKLLQVPTTTFKPSDTPVVSIKENKIPPFTYNVGEGTYAEQEEKWNIANKNMLNKKNGGLIKAPKMYKKGGVTGDDKPKFKAPSNAEKVTVVPSDYNKLGVEGNKTYYDKKSDTAIGGSLPGSNWEQSIIKRLESGVSPESLIKEGHISPSQIDKYKSYYKPIYTEQAQVDAVKKGIPLDVSQRIDRKEVFGQPSGVKAFSYPDINAGYSQSTTRYFDAANPMKEVDISKLKYDEKGLPVHSYIESKPGIEGTVKDNLGQTLGANDSLQETKNKITDVYSRGFKKGGLVKAPKRYVEGGDVVNDEPKVDASGKPLISKDVLNKAAASGTNAAEKAASGDATGSIVAGGAFATDAAGNIIDAKSIDPETGLYKSQGAAIGAGALKGAGKGAGLGLTIGANPALMAATGGLSAPIGAGAGAILGAGVGGTVSGIRQKKATTALEEAKALAAEEEKNRLRDERYAASLSNEQIARQEGYANGGLIQTTSMAGTSKNVDGDVLTQADLDASAGYVPDAGIVEKQKIGLPEFGTGVTGPKLTASFKKGGYVHGPGTGTSDSVKAKIEAGSFITPAKNAKAAEKVLEHVEGMKKGGVAKAPSMKKKADLDQEEGEDVKLSKGEFVFTPEQREEIISELGEDVLEALAPDAEHGEDEMKNGGLTAAKAKIILHDGTIRGKAITDKQRKYFGAIASGYECGGKVNGMKNGGDFLPLNRDSSGNARKKLYNKDGSVSTESVIGITTADGKNYNIPTVVNGVRLSEDDAIKHFEKTGEHTGVYDTIEEANKGAASREKANIGLGSTGLYKKGGMVKKYADGTTPEGVLSDDERAKLAAQEKAIKEKESAYTSKAEKEKKLAEVRAEAYKKSMEAQEFRSKAKKELDAEVKRLEREYKAKKQSYDQYSRDQENLKNAKSSGGFRAQNNLYNEKEVIKKKKELLDLADKYKKDLDTRKNELNYWSNNANFNPDGSIKKDAKKTGPSGINYLGGDNETAPMFTESGAKAEADNATTTAVNKGKVSTAPKIGKSNASKPIYTGPTGETSVSEVATETTTPVAPKYGEQGVKPTTIMSDTLKETVTEDGTGNKPSNAELLKAGMGLGKQIGGLANYILPYKQTQLGRKFLAEAGDRPVDKIDPDFLKSVETAQANAKFGYSPEEQAMLDQKNVSALRAGQGAARLYSGGSAANAYGMSRDAANQFFGRGLQAAVAGKQLQMSKQAQADQMVANKAEASRRLFNDQMNAWTQNQQSGAALLGAGIKNMIGAQRYNQEAAFQEKLANGENNWMNTIAG